MAFTTARLNAALDAATIAAGVSRAALTGVGSASAGSDSITGSWTIPAAGGPFTHFSLWTASTAGTFNGDGTLTPSETFAGAGTLNFTITATAT